MKNSNVEYLWKEKQHLVNLRRIDLSGSENLIEIPCLVSATRIEIVNLIGCSRLTMFPEVPWNSNIKMLLLNKTAIEEVPSAIGSLNKLTKLKLQNCRRLKNLPSEIRNLTSLLVLELLGCPNITKFPEVPGNLKCLLLARTGIEEVPSSIDSDLPKLVTLGLQRCTSLKSLPSSIFKLKSLQFLYLNGCSKLDALPEIPKMAMGKLSTIFLEGTAIKELPSSIDRLPHLSTMYIQKCKNIVRLPDSFCNLTSLTNLALTGCSGVDKLLENFPPLSGLRSLDYLFLDNCNLLEFPSAFANLSSLSYLDVRGNSFESLSLKPFSRLDSLYISCCKKLKLLQDFPSPWHVRILQADKCISLETLPSSKDVSFTVDWTNFVFSNCLKLDENTRRNILEDAQLRIQAVATGARGTSSEAITCVAGSEIPKWFINENEGSSITIQLPPNWCTGGNKFLGFALCVVVASEDYSENNPKDFLIESKCNFETNDDDCSYNIDNSYLNCFSCIIESTFLASDHVFMLYDHKFYPRTVDGDHMFSKYQSCQKVSFEFSPVDMSQQPLLNCRVKKCGVQLLYSKEECRESSDEAEISVSGSDDSSDVDEDDTNFRSLNEVEPKSESEVRVKLVFKILLVGLVLFTLWWIFLGIAIAN